MGHIFNDNNIKIKYSKKKISERVSRYFASDLCLLFRLILHNLRNSFISDGFFNRIMARAASWSQTQGGLEPKLLYRHGVFFVDDFHEFTLHMASLSDARIKV